MPHDAGQSSGSSLGQRPGESGSTPLPATLYVPRYKGDACREPIHPICAEELHLCPACGRMSSAGHRQVCLAPGPRAMPRKPKKTGWPIRKDWPKKGETFPRCKCGRALVPNRQHTCKPLRRSHRRPETDALPASPTRTAPREIPLLPFPTEGVEFPCKVSSELNLSRWHWRGRRVRSHDQRRRVHDALAPYERPRLPAEITIVRTGWNHLDEHDNLRTACKSVADACAEYMGVDDRDKRITWKYGQIVTRETEIMQTRKGPARQSVNRIRIQVRTREDVPDAG
jgi:hypothetical protein